MTVFLFCAGIVQCVLLWLLAQGGNKLAGKAEKEHELARHEPPVGWPRCAVIIPVSGSNARMEAALRSLLEQNYPDFSVYLVTATNDDPAMPLIRLLESAYSNVTHVTAGLATDCGQKNLNLLSGVAAAGEACDVYVFCDSTHAAEHDFLRCLINPIAYGETVFTTGYHEVEPQDNSTVSVAYALSVLAMRLMQGLALFTQPWGGATAMSRQAFIHYKIARLWATNVVDDCSLGCLLNREGAHVRLCPAALLLTVARKHPLPVWNAWLERQILFLKFCQPWQWLALGLFCLLMIAPPVWCALALLKGLFGFGGNTAPFLALCWACSIVWVVDLWRRFARGQIQAARWLWAFFCAIAMFCLCYLATFLKRSIVWQGISYQVGKNGQVEKIIVRRQTPRKQDG